MCADSCIGSDRSLSEKSSLINSSGTFKISYRPDCHWDFHVDSSSSSIDLSLALPHYRARRQPIEHRLNMFVGSEVGPAKVKVCRSQPRMRFYLEIHASASDVTVWLPSDFKGQIHHSGRAVFSAGFTNRISQNVKFNRQDLPEDYAEDCVVVVAIGRITFRMWDTLTLAPENVPKEALKRLFGGSRRKPSVAMNWDFLLED